jgi:uncharacterized protein with HEPN domain
MKRPNDAVRLRHMLEATEKALGLTAGRKRADLESDEMLLLALTRLIEIIGEAASGVSSECREANPSIPWQQVIGARNHLIHGYFDVDCDIVWQIAELDLPKLASDLRIII